MGLNDLGRFARFCALVKREDAGQRRHAPQGFLELESYSGDEDAEEG